MLTQDFAPQRWRRGPFRNRQVDLMVAVFGHEVCDLGLSPKGDQHDLVSTEVGDLRLDAQGGWAWCGPLGAVESKGHRPRVGLHA